MGTGPPSIARRLGAWLRSQASRIWAWISVAVAWARAGARAESRRRRIAWAVAAAVLVLGPVAFNLARQSGFDATVELFPVATPPYPAIDSPRYYHALLSEAGLRQEMTREVGSLFDPGDVTLRPHRMAGHPTVLLTVRGDTPAHAQRVVNALAPQIQGATRRELLSINELAAERVVRAIRRAHATKAPLRVRRRLAARLRTMRRIAAAQPVRMLPGRPADRPRLTRWTDRLANSMPGSFPARPPVVSVALAGLIVLVTLWAIALALVPPRGRRGGEVVPQAGARA